MMAQGSNGGGVSLAWIPGVLALVVSVFTLWWNYAQAERRRSADILRNALIDISSGPIADARDGFAAMLSEPSGQEFSEFRRTYFVLCWSLQRAKSALDESAKRKKSHGRDELYYHFTQVALMVLSVHTVLRDNFQNSKDKLFDDTEIWGLIGDDIKAVTPSGWKPESTGKILYYFYKQSSGSEEI